MAKYLKLENGKEIEFYDYYVTNACIVKFLSTDFNTIKDFFGDMLVQSIEIEDEKDGEKSVIEMKELGGMRRTDIHLEKGLIHETEEILVSKAYDEEIEVVIGHDDEGNDIKETQTIHHDAEYKSVVKDIPVEFIVAVLERPSAEEQINEMKQYIGVVDEASLDLNGWKDHKQELNKEALKDFLSTATVKFNDKEYGVTEDDQNEMSLNYMQYQVSKQAGIEEKLEWHAKKEKCVEFTEEDFLKLTLLVKSFVYPYMNQMQEYKERIYACNSIDEVKAIEFSYIIKEAE